ncbi:PREDICTED: mucin-15 [Elephantulus edwardii]|uniref:mucin-15 n=1 Tax=Elephantulus edwardii TaxID=28737 RepID=UPI0003F06847|nr:PREDICTED: mucin-15 [Elephantulus edwardii]
MLILGKILLLSMFFCSLLLGSFGKENSEISTTETKTEVLQTMRRGSVSLENEEELDKTNSETSNPYTTHIPIFDSLNKVHTKTTLPRDWSTDNPSGSISPTTTSLTTPSVIHSIVSKLPLNSSVLHEHILPVSVPPNATQPDVPSENFTSSLTTLTNDAMNPLDHSSMTVSILPPAPTTTSVTTLITEPTPWLTTTNNSLAEFTPYQETTTPQPTLKFTNSSKIFQNTADPQEEENRNTGVVFGAILGAILGASLLSFVGYLLCGRRKTDSFSHRRLYDDRNEPVLRLDNAPEPYDVSFGNSSYYNATVIGSAPPEGREHARDGIPMDDIPPLRTPV